MEIKRTLDSTGWRRLFECVKTEGIEPVINFVADIRSIPDRITLIQRATLYGKNDLVTLVEKNLDMIKYVREHKEEFDSMDFADESVFQTLDELSDDITLLKTYLENARKLEDLKVNLIRFENNLYFLNNRHFVVRNREGKIIEITKCYTDGIIKFRGESLCNEYNEYDDCCISVISTRIDDEKASFVLFAHNSEKEGPTRYINIKDFGFDSKKLPIEEELQSYEIPKTYILK